MLLRSITQLGSPLLVLRSLTGCAVAPLYHSTVSAHRAEVYFTSPYYEDIFLSVDRLALLIYSADTNCEMTSQGRVPLVTEVAARKSVYVAANERLYLQVWQYNSDAISQVTQKRSGYFSFVPQNNKTYEIRHIDNPKNIGLEVHELSKAQGGNLEVVELQPWSSCYDL